MDNATYKKKVSQWNVKRRTIVEDTLALLKDKNPSLHEKLEPVLEQNPVEKPWKHSGGKETDFFEVHLSKDEVEEIVSELFDLEASAVPMDEGLGSEEAATQSREASRIASLVDDWNKLNKGTC